MKKAMISLMLCLVLISSIVLARTPNSEVMPPGQGCTGASDHEVDTPIEWPDEPDEPTTPVYRHSGSSHNEVIECQEGTPCEIIVCDERIKAEKNGVKYLFTIRTSYKHERDIVSVSTDDNKWGVLAYSGSLLTMPDEQGCYKVIVGN